MGRQPYLPTYAKKPYAVGALILKDSPRFCEAIGKCIAIWTQVDNEMGCLLGILLGANSDATIEVFLSLRRASSQRDALAAAALHTLQGDELAACNAILAVYKSLERQRNDLAHGCYGTCPEDPDILFWIDVKEHVHFQTETLALEHQGIIHEDRHKRLKANLFVYRMKDLHDLYEKMEQFWWATFYFNGYLRERQNPLRAQEFQKLCSYPDIQREISRQTGALT